MIHTDWKEYEFVLLKMTPSDVKGLKQQPKQLAKKQTLGHLKESHASQTDDVAFA